MRWPLVGRAVAFNIIYGLLLSTASGMEKEAFKKTGPALGPGLSYYKLNFSLLRALVNPRAN
jgi:hypothetical protein